MSAEQVEPVVVRTPKFWSFLGLFAAALMFAASLLIALTDPYPQLIAWLGVLLAIGLAVACLSNIFRGVPRIEVGPRGIRYLTSFKTRTWSWSEVGPFEIVALERIYPLKPHFCACAFLQRHHALLSFRNTSQELNDETADVTLHLKHTWAGRNRETADAFVNDLNEWRSRCGNPEAELDESDPHGALAAFRKSLKDRRRNLWIAIGVIGVVTWVGHTFIFPYLVQGFF